MNAYEYQANFDIDASSNNGGFGPLGLEYVFSVFGEDPIWLIAADLTDNPIVNYQPMACSSSDTYAFHGCTCSTGGRSPPAGLGFGSTFRRQWSISLWSMWW